MASTESKKVRRKKVRKARERENNDSPSSSRSPDIPHSDFDVVEAMSGHHSHCHLLPGVQLNKELRGNGEKCISNSNLLKKVEQHAGDDHHQTGENNSNNCCCESNNTVIDGAPPDIFNDESNDDVPTPDDFSYPLHTSPEPDPLANNPYLNREKCLLCQRDRTEDDESDSEDEELKIGPHNYALSQMSLWVCAKCKATLEDEERKGLTEPSFLNEEVVEPDANALKFLAEMQMATGRNGSNEETDLKTCECEACKDRRQIEQDQDQENAKLQLCWGELLHSIRCVYREGKRCLLENGGKLDKHKQKQHVSRLCARDSHQLYQRLESHAIDYILEVKVKLLQQLTSGHSTPEQARAFMALMLEEYAALACSSSILSDIFKQLEKEHLQRFSLNWELHDKHLFQNVIYSDPVVQNSVPMLITQLRIGAATKEAYVENSYPFLLHKYLKFDDEMAVVAVVWRDVQHRIDQYTDEQAAIQAKQRMLREDWEFFSAQRKILKEQMMKNNRMSSWLPKSMAGEALNPPPVPTTSGFEAIATATSTSSNNKCLDAQFTDAMKSLFDDHTGLKREPFTCPNCKSQICSCHECSISHLISCGVLSPELQDALFPVTGPAGSCGASNNPFAITPSSIGYDISVKAPSFSSTDSSSEADSDSPHSGYLSTDSWDEKLKLNPNINLFEEFLKDAAREPPALRKENSNEEVDKITPNDLSLPSPCQCHECKKPLSTSSSTSKSYTSSSSSSNSTIDSVPVSSVSKPAALHLYPHIHGSKTTVDPVQRSAGHSTTGGNLATAQYKSILQPQLYKLHNPLHQQSQILKQLDKLKSQQKKESSAFSAPLSGSILQPCIKEQLKAQQQWTTTTSSDMPPYPFYNSITGLKGGGASLSSTFNAYTSGLKFPELQNYPNTTRVNTDAWTTPPFNSSAFSLDPVMTANVPHVTSNSSRATKLHSWQMMAQQVQPSCLLAYPNALDSDTPHEHTDECFKYLNSPMPLPASRHAPVSHTTALPTSHAKKCTKVELDLYNKLKSGAFTPVTSTTNAAAAVTTATSSLSEQRQTSVKDVQPVISCIARTTAQQVATTQASTTAKTSTSTKVSVSSTKSSTSSISTCHHAAAAVKHKQILSAGKATNDTIKKIEAVRHNAVHKTSNPSQNCGETEGGGSPLPSDEEDGDSCSGQSSSTSNSNQKDSKYCDCCYCEFFGHGQPTPAPTSKNYAEIRERLRRRLKKKQKNDSPCAKGHHDLVPISELKNLAVADALSGRAAALNLHKEAVMPKEPKPHLDADRPCDQKKAPDYPDVEELVKFITGEEAQSSDTSKPDKKQRKKQKRAEQKARKLEVAKQLPEADSKTWVANSESDEDSDSDKIIAQQQSKSRHNNKKSFVPPEPTQPQSKKAKGEDNSKTVESSRQSRSPDNEKVKSKSAVPSAAQSPKSANSRTTKTSKVSVNSSTDSTPVSGITSVGPQRSQQLNNTKSPGKADPHSNRQHQRTHNDLQGSGDGSKSQASRTTSKLAEKKVTDKHKGDNLIENKLKGGGDRANNMEEKHLNMLNTKNSQSVGKDSRKGSSNQRQQPDGQEDMTDRRAVRLLNGKRHNQTSVQRRGAKGEASADLDVFMPIDDEQVEDSFEKELNEFKRFVMSAPAPESKITANVNMKDLQLSKKKGVTC